LVNKLTGETQDVHLTEYSSLQDIDCSTRTGLILAVLRNAEKFQIRVFRRDGSDQRSVIEESDRIFSARWSPAGDSIYYLHGKGSTTEFSRISIKDKHAEPVAIANGLQTGGFFTLSADGSRLAYTRAYHHADLWQLRLQSVGAKPEIKRLTSGTSLYAAPSFSPDGRWMSFVLGPNPDETNIYKMPSAGGEPVQLTYFEHATTTSPAWSPDGQRIAFVSDQNGTPRVWMISADGGTPQPLERTNASNTNWDLAWWPSNEVVYQKAGLHNYLRVNDKTQAEETIIQNGESKGWLVSKPIFSPDGKRLAVYWNRYIGMTPGLGLWIVSLEPYSETFVQTEMEPFGWSLDGKRVYAVQQTRREIVTISVASPNDVVSIANLPGDVGILGCGVCRLPTLSPDGRQIIASLAEEKSDVWLLENFDPSSRATRGQQ
jgi:Tol biopolymer transport system component